MHFASSHTTLQSSTIFTFSLNYNNFVILWIYIPFNKTKLVDESKY